MPTIQEDVVQLHNAKARSNIVLVCEHASHHIPAHLLQLGLSPSDRLSHAVWDPGAFEVAIRLSRMLGAKLVASNISRLVYDCNRPPESAEAIRDQSELVKIPGNTNLTDSDRLERATNYYEPFRAAVAQVMQATINPVLVTVHSFTPIYNGKPRSVEIGILHDEDAALADAILALEKSSFNVCRNEPYGPEDEVTHTLKEHGVAASHLNVMLEIRNDLIADASQQDQIATLIADWLTQALARLKNEGHAA